MAPKLHEFAVILVRDGKQTPWGIRLVGGSDLDTPLIITKVCFLYYFISIVLRSWKLIGNLQTFDVLNIV